MRPKAAATRLTAETKSTHDDNAVRAFLRPPDKFSAKSCGEDLAHQPGNVMNVRAEYVHNWRMAGRDPGNWIE